MTKDSSIMTSTEESLMKIPDLSLADYPFWYGILKGIYSPGSRYKPRMKTGSSGDVAMDQESEMCLPETIRGWTAETLQSELVKICREKLMLPWYEVLCSELGWSIDTGLKSELEKEVRLKLSALDDAIEDAEKNLGESEIREAHMRKAEFFSTIGDKDKAGLALRIVYEKSTSLGQRLDIIFHQIRLGFFFNDQDSVRRHVERAKSLIEEGGDWDRRNRLKAYEGMYFMSIRNFKQAAELFLDSLSTFTSTELISFNEFIKYAVLMCTIALDRPNIKKRVIHAPEILEVLPHIPEIRELMESLYNCNYRRFFVALASVEDILKYDRYLHLHYRYYIRNMRRIAYSQLLQSYRSLTLISMAEAFGVTVDYIDRELSRLISSKQLNCTIDKVKGIVETTRADAKDKLHRSSLKQGDILINRMQKLSRFITI